MNPEEIQAAQEAAYAARQAAYTAAGDRYDLDLADLQEEFERKRADVKAHHDMEIEAADQACAQTLADLRSAQ